MKLDLTPLNDAPRLLLEADLAPAQGRRFQPTGFPDLGPATYKAPNADGGSVDMLLVESAQSMANRLEAVCWDDREGHPVKALEGLPYVAIDLGQYGETSTFQEFHRLNSPYIWHSQEADAQDFKHAFLNALGLPAQRAKKGADTTEEGGTELPGVLDMQRFYRTLLKYDPNSLVHGVFLEKVAGRYRVPRLLSAFIEARQVERAENGGVKLDRVFPAKPKDLDIQAKDGFTNVPFPRTEFAAAAITAYFNLDLTSLRALGLGPKAEALLVGLALYKVRRFLDGGLRLRSNCDLDLLAQPRAARPTGFELPALADLEAALPELIEGAAEGFARPAVTRLSFKPKPRKSSKDQN
jgi:CRISPR-associated protein Csb1